MHRLLIILGFPPALGGIRNTCLYARCLAAKPGGITVLAPAVPGRRVKG